MRFRLNRSLKTKNKSAPEHGKGRQTATVKPNKIKNELDITELVIQIAFIIAIETAIFISLHTFHLAALIILFKCLTNFPKERNIEEPRENLVTKKNTKKLEKKKIRMETIKMHDQTSPRHNGGYKPHRHHNKI